MAKPYSKALVFAVSATFSLAWSHRAGADELLIDDPGEHPDYIFDAEPHLLLGVFKPPGPAAGTGLGVGFRGTIEIFDNGFVPSINNTVGIGFGVDWMRYDRADRACVNQAAGSNCRIVQVEESVDYFWIPVVLQWNFWLSDNWSVFGEPGVALRVTNEGDSEVSFDPFNLWVGGRFHFSDAVALTMRIGYPTFSIGVSFLF